MSRILPKSICSFIPLQVFPLCVSVVSAANVSLWVCIAVEFSESSCYSHHSGCRHLVYLPPQLALTAHTLMRQIKVSALAVTDGNMSTNGANTTHKLELGRISFIFLWIYSGDYPSSTHRNF